MRNMGGYSYANNPSLQHAPVLPPPLQQQQQQQQQIQQPQPQQPQPHPYNGSSPAQQYTAATTTESDAHYWRKMWRELGYGESTDGSPSPAINGFALTMPDGGYGVSQHTPPGASTIASYESNGHTTTHGGYTNHVNSGHRFQPYPQPSYNGHASHSGYGGIVAR